MTIRQELARFGRALMGSEPGHVRDEKAFLRQMGGLSTADIQRAYNPEWQGLVDSYALFQGQLYQPGYTTTYAGQKAEPVLDSFIGYVQGAYKSNGVVFAVSMARARLFTDITFKWRRYGQSGGGNDLFGTPELGLLERPWPGGTTQQLLMRAEQDVTNAGTFFVAREDDWMTPRLRRLRPDWCQFILNAPPDEAVQSDVIGIKYTVGGPFSGGQSRLYLVDRGDDIAPDAAFWSPIPDPDAQYRGMSWLSPVIKEKILDQALTDHTIKFFENAATPNLGISLKESVTPEVFRKFVREMNDASVGINNAHKNLYLGGGADITVIGAMLDKLDLRNIQGPRETRVCAAGGVPPIIVGMSEGLDAATYSNYGQARRAFGDSWGRPQWKSFAGAIAPILEHPRNAAGVVDAQLWYDTTDVAFLREDMKDLAETQSITMATINAAVASGWTTESALRAILAEDLSLLEHSGLVSVQLQAPGTEPTTEPAPEPAADDAERSIHYSRPMTTDIDRHATHNQKSHGNRVGKSTNVAGRTGLSKAADLARVGTNNARLDDEVRLVRGPNSGSGSRLSGLGERGRVRDIDGAKVIIELDSGRYVDAHKSNIEVTRVADDLEAEDRARMDAESERLRQETRERRAREGT